MAVSPHSMPENSIDFRAPPPSPVASGRRSCVTNEDVLTEFLQHSLRVPNLILPDKIFPRQKIVETPPRIDFQSLVSFKESDAVSKILDSTARTGCFQLVNHGVPSEFIRLVLATAAGVFQISPEKRSAVTRSTEKVYGFEAVHDEEESEELREEFVWCRDESLKLQMEGIWQDGYSNFSEKMETLLSDLEKVAEKILLVLQDNFPGKSMKWQDHDQVGSICYLSKQRLNVPSERLASSLGYDVIRMLIRGTDYSHALSLHICQDSSEFHVYSKKGWVSFCPDQDAIVVTVGDQTQALSAGHYKHVLGRPIFQGEKGEDCISMAFLYSPTILTTVTTIASTTVATTTTTTTTPTTGNGKAEKGKTISLGQQAIVAVILTLVYQFLVYVYKQY